MTGAGLGIATIGQLVAVARTTVSAANAARRLVGGDLRWLNVGSGGERFSASELADISAFLGSDSLIPLLQFAWIGLAVEGDRLEPIASAREAFEAAAVTWCARSDGRWVGRAGAVWDSVASRIRGLLPRQLPAEVSAQLDQQWFLPGALDDPAGRDAYLTKLLELGGNLERLSASVAIAQEVADLASRSYQLSLAHLDAADEVLDRNALYVERNVTVDGVGYPSTFLVDPSRVMRTVVLGNPGAGKTSLVNHLASLSGGGAALPIVVCKCREYASNDWALAIEAALFKSLQASGIHSGEPALIGALLLGHIAVVFDGMDEITDVQRRQEMVTRIVRFGAMFPLVSIVVTSRAIGYERTPLPRAAFDRAILDEYDDAQAAEYARRWFQSVSRPELHTVFMNDVRQISDIAHNPLMLSLLCSLYRARGHLPTNRHGVYHQCAELLYRQWDAQRQITQSEDLPDYGTAIMCSIANFFWSVPSATNADEAQLRKLIAVELQQGGASADSADVRAGEFLDFCKDRLWLLVRGATNSRGDQTFEFAHRTFLEYFASEYFARSADGPERLAACITDSYAKDPTSAMPELLIQSYDAKRSPGAPAVYRVVLTSRNPILCLRLMNAKLPEPRRAEGFAVVEDYLGSGKPLTLEGFEAALALYRDPREQLVRDYLHDDTTHLSRALVDGWCAYALLGRNTDPGLPLGETLDPLLAERVRRLAGRDLTVSDFSLIAFAIARGLLPLAPATVLPMLFFPGFGEDQWSLAYQLLYGERTSLLSREARFELASTLCDIWAQGEGVPREFVTARVPQQGLDIVTADHLSQSELQAVFGLLAVLREALSPQQYKTSAAWLHTALATRIDVEAVLAVRRHYVDGGAKPDLSVALRLKTAMESLPGWVNRWVVGQHWLTSTARPRESAWRAGVGRRVHDRVAGTATHPPRQ